MRLNLRHGDPWKDKAWAREEIAESHGVQEPSPKSIYQLADKVWMGCPFAICRSRVLREWSIISGDEAPTPDTQVFKEWK